MPAVCSMEREDCVDGSGFLCVRMSYILYANAHKYQLQIIEGSITFFLAIIAWFFMPHFPHKNTFLTSEQTELVLKRVDDDRGDALPDPVTLRNIKLHLSDWTLWAYGLFPTRFILPLIITTCRLHVYVRLLAK